MDPGDPVHMARIRESLRDNRDKMRTACKQRLEVLKQYVGPYYGPEGSGSDSRRPINNIEKGLNIYSYLLVGGVPQLEVLSEAQPLRPMARAASITINMELERRRVSDVLQRWVRASILSLGVVQCGWKRYGSVYDPASGQYVEVGDWTLDLISLDDLVIDFSQRTLEAGRFMGHRFDMDLEEAQENPAYNRAARQALQPSDVTYVTEFGTRKAESLSRGHSMWTGELEDKCLLVQLHLRREQLLVVFDPEGDGPPLSIEEYKGPAEGPYEWISYNEVEDNPLPLPPVAVWRDLDNLANAVASKLGDSAINQKDVLGYEEGAEDDVERLLAAPHLGTAAMKNPKAAQMFSFNGPNQMNLAFLLQVLEWANNLQGNPDLLAGLGQQADTATQENLLTTAAGARMEAMRDRVSQATDRVLRRVSWYYWRDPARLYQGQQQVAGTPYTLPIAITPAMREGTWDYLNFQLIPYSLKPTPPAQRLQQLRGMMQEMIALQPLADAQGIKTRLDRYLELAARYLHMPEISELFEYGTPQLPMGEPPTNKPNTTRTYIRKNVPSGGTQQGRTAAKMQGLMGNASPQQQTATLQPGAA